MKIGILTLHEANSYGAVLQAYALQQTLTKLGAESEFLSFTENTERTERAENKASNPLIQRIRLAGERRSALFADFRRKHLVCAPACPLSDATELNSIYDCFIAGSDQVWNMQIPGVDGRYFLPFATPNKRCSYAASFGAEKLPKKVQSWCATQLAAFKELSVREESGRRLIRELTGREASVCLDPTLLPDHREWSRLTRPVEGSPYVLLFLLEYDAKLAAQAKETALAQGLELRVCTASFMPQFGLDAWCKVDVEHWLSLFQHAESVFTNSFHGVVFSLIFARPLYAARLTGSLSGRNGRMEELLQSIGMEAAFDGVCPPVPQDLFEERMSGKRKDSMEYLRKITLKEDDRR